MNMLALWQLHGDSAMDSHDDQTASDHGATSAHQMAGGHDEQGAAGHEAEHEGGSKIPELPNLLGVVHEQMHGNPQVEAFQGQLEQLGFNDPNGDAFTAFETVFFGLLVVLGLSIFFMSAARKLKVKAGPGEKLSGKAMFAEIVFEFFEDFFGAIVGREKVRRHLPLVGTLFIYILVCNCLGLLFLGKAPTANLSFNLAMAFVVFLYVHGNAIMQKPFLIGWLKHFPGELASPKDMGPMAYFLGPILAILFTVIHVMELFIQPVSLALRLYGNLLGKDVLLGVFSKLMVVGSYGVGMGVDSMPPGTWFAVPLHAPFLFLGLLLGAIQALIFSLLSAVYITMWEPHEHHDHDHAEHAHSHA